MIYPDIFFVFIFSITVKCWYFSSYFYSFFNNIFWSRHVFFESGLPWGVEWWKYWFCSFFWDMEMVCTWSHKSRLSRILHFLQRCCLFPKTLYFLLSILEKKTCLYTMFLMPAMNSVLLLYILLYHMYTHIYIYTYLHTHTLWQIYHFFHKNLCFSKICIWYWTYMSAISSCKFCIFWNVFCILSCCSWVLFKKNMSKLNMHFFKRWFNYDWIWTFSRHHLYFALKALPCWIKSSTLAGNQYTLYMKAQLKLEKCTSWKDCCILNIFLRRSCILKTTLLSAVNCVLYLCENEKNTSTGLKDLLHALHDFCPFQRR